MITMKTGSKTPVRFIFSDDVSETTITIAPDDDSGAIAAKLQRVLELEGVALPTAPPAPVAPGVTLANIFTPADRAATEVRLAQAQPQGWGADVDVEKLPEM